MGDHGIATRADDKPWCTTGGSGVYVRVSVDDDEAPTRALSFKKHFKMR